MRRKLVFRLVHEEARKNAIAALSAAPAGYVCVIQEETRNLQQNALMWPVLRCFSRQVKLAVDGELVFLDEEAWKDVLTGAYSGEQARMVKYDGHLVLVGRSTSQMGKAEFAEFMTWMLQQADEKGVVIPPAPAEEIADYIRENSHART